MVERPEYLSDEVNLLRQNIDELEDLRQAMIRFNDANPRNADLPPEELIRLEDERGKMTQSMLSNICYLGRMDIGDIAEVCVDPMKYYAWIKDVKEFVIDQMRDELNSRDNIVNKALKSTEPYQVEEPDPLLEQIREYARQDDKMADNIIHGILIVLGIIVIMAVVAIVSIVSHN